MPENHFVPPRCPNRACAAFRRPVGRFYLRRGSYRARCRTKPVPRFSCRLCKRSFSRQTFRMDYRDRRPETNARLFMLLVSGCGLRQAGEILELSSGAVQRKFQKLGRQMRCLNRNMLRELPNGLTIIMDELETFETRPTSRLTVGIAVEPTSKLILVSDIAPIRRVPKRGSRQRSRLARYEARHGRRADRGTNCVRRVLARLERLLRGQGATLITDRKAVYRSQCQRRFGRQVHHLTSPSNLPHWAHNPLFAIQLTKQMLRRHNGRLHGRSWLVSKRCAHATPAARDLRGLPQLAPAAPQDRQF